ERYEGVVRTSHLGWQPALLAPLRRSKAAAVALALGLIEDADRFLIVFGAAVHDRARQQRIRMAGGGALGGIEQLAGAGKIAIGFLHARPAIEGLVDAGLQPHGFLVERPRLVHPSLIFQIPG